MGRAAGDMFTAGGGGSGGCLQRSGEGPNEEESRFWLLCALSG